MNILTYDRWPTTCTAVHEVLQMMGKVKLATMMPQPEWGHVVLQIEPDSFSTGLIPLESGGFEIKLNVADANVEAVTASGERASFSLMGRASVSTYYEYFQTMLQHIGQCLALNPRPQFMALTQPFNEQRQPHEFDAGSLRRSFRQFLFARSALGRFSSPFRGKQTPPSLYWGSFDLTTTLFSGVPHPYDSRAPLIARVALDEQLMRFGFWPGGEQSEKPTFYALAYPFLEEGSSEDMSLRGAFFDHASAKYLFPLEAACAYEDPEQAVMHFCRDACISIVQRQQWNHLDWFLKPLLNAENSPLELL